MIIFRSILIPKKLASTFKENRYLGRFVQWLFLDRVFIEIMTIKSHELMFLNYLHLVEDF